MVNKNKFSHLDLKKIIDDYHLIKSVPVVAKKHNTTVYYIRQKLKEHNIKIYPKSITNRVDTKAIIDAYLKNRNAGVIAKEFNISKTSVLKILHSNNIHVRIYQYTDQELIAAYFKYESSGYAAKQLNVGEGLILSVLKKNNITPLYVNRIKDGDVFGMLTVIRHTYVRITKGGYQQKMFECKCECGNVVEIPSQKLTATEGKKSCGCLFTKKLEEWEVKRKIKKERREEWEKVLAERAIKKQQKEIKKRAPKFKVGDIKNRLTILSITDGPRYKSVVLCKCLCGNIKEYKYKSFIGIQSCGCLQVERSTTHGMRSKYGKWYDRWRGMIRRCYNTKCHSYHNYGGRGIKVCDRWLEPNGGGCENYYNDVHNILGSQPSENHSLDRIDNNGMYEIRNMRWATLSEQSKNQRRHLK